MARPPKNGAPACDRQHDRRVLATGAEETARSLTWFASTCRSAMRKMGRPAGHCNVLDAAAAHLRLLGACAANRECFRIGEQVAARLRGEGR